MTHISEIQVQQLEDTANYRALIELLENPNTLQDYSMSLINAYLGLNLIEQAEHQLDIMVIGTYNMADWHYYKGRCQLEKGKYDFAIKHFNKGLENILHHTKTYFLTFKINLYLANCFYYIGQIERALSCLDKIQANQHLIKRKFIIGYMYLFKGVIYSYKSDYQYSSQLYQTALDIGQKVDNLQLVGAAYNNLGLNASNAGKIIQGKDLINKALECRRKIGNLSKIASSLNNLAVIQYKLGHIEHSIELFNEAIQHLEHINKLKELASCYNNLGNIYKNQGQITDATALYEKAIAIHQKMGDLHGEAITVQNLGQIFYLRGELQQSLELYLKAEQIWQQFHSQINIAGLKLELGENFFQLGEKQKALTYINEGLHLFQAFPNTINIAQAVFTAFKIYIELNEPFESKKFLVYFPEPPYESPLILAYKSMIDGLIAENQFNYNLAENFLIKALKIEGIDYR